MSLKESIYSTPAAKRALKLHESRLAAADKVRQSAGMSKMTYEQKLATAVTLDNTARHIRAMEALSYGATQPANIGQYKRFSIRESVLA